MTGQCQEITVGMFEFDGRKIAVSVRSGDLAGTARLTYRDNSDGCELGTVGGLDRNQPQLWTRWLMPRSSREAIVKHTIDIWTTAFTGETS
ncbi:hypothetical protein [Natronoglycomyces albus]|uniref:Uncharacterized protein n=1 Tax=Natronoglycomyces albus TaxID=2811108 RepID=A0A895XT22_9ACTN|nr:hypothetical protein [Natronoglycomyces albus]QSB06643.1 hypothetical protein JQS30_07040 [Natronoglycomyces albus]